MAMLGVYRVKNGRKLLVWVLTSLGYGQFVFVLGCLLGDASFLTSSLASGAVVEAVTRSTPGAVSLEARSRSVTALDSRAHSVAWVKINTGLFGSSLRWRATPILSMYTLQWHCVYINGFHVNMSQHFVTWYAWCFRAAMLPWVFVDL